MFLVVAGNCFTPRLCSANCWPALGSSERRIGTDQRSCPEHERFEIPARYRHLEQVHLRYARWDLSRIDLVDPRTGAILCAVKPQDKSANANGARKRLTPAALDLSPLPPQGLPALMTELLADYAAPGVPPRRRASSCGCRRSSAPDAQPLLLGTPRPVCVAMPRPGLRGAVPASRTGWRCGGAHGYTNEQSDRPTAVPPTGGRRPFVDRPAGISMS
jgi:hypothetical protein